MKKGLFLIIVYDILCGVQQRFSCSKMLDLLFFLLRVVRNFQHFPERTKRTLGGEVKFTHTLFKFYGNVGQIVSSAQYLWLNTAFLI